MQTYVQPESTLQMNSALTINCWLYNLPKAKHMWEDWKLRSRFDWACSLTNTLKQCEHQLKRFSIFDFRNNKHLTPVKYEYFLVLWYSECKGRLNESKGYMQETRLTQPKTTSTAHYQYIETTWICKSIGNTQQTQRNMKQTFINRKTGVPHCNGRTKATIFLTRFMSAQAHPHPIRPLQDE